MGMRGVVLVANLLAGAPKRMAPLVKLSIAEKNTELNTLLQNMQ